MCASPGISLLLGPPNSGKLGTVLGWFKEHYDEQPLLVVPARGDVATITVELVERMGGLVGARPVVTFPGLVSAVLARPLSLPSRPGRGLLLRRLLEQLQLAALGPLAALPGTPAALEDLFRELDESGLSPNEVQGALERWQEADGGAFAAELAALYGGYANALDARGEAEMGTWTHQAGQAARGWRRPVACYGFTSLTPVQRLLLEALAREAPLLLSFIDPDHHPVGSLTKQEVSWWLPRAAQVERVFAQKRVYSSPGLEYLAANYEADQPGPSPDSPESDMEGVRFLVASGRRNELELAGREIVRLLHAGVDPGDIAVLVRRLDPWSALVRQVFDSYGIPFRIDQRVPWGNTGLGHAILQGMRGLIGQEEDVLLSFLRSPYCTAEPDRVDRAEVRLRRRGQKGAAALPLLLRWFPEDLAGFARLLREQGPEALSERLTEMAEQLLRSAAEIGVLERGRLEEDARALAVLQRLAAELADARETGAAWPSLLSVLQSAPVSLGREEEPGVVHVLSVTRARPRRYSVVFLLGLVDGEFPLAEGPSGLLTSEQRRAAGRAAGGPLFRSPAESLDEALFALALTRAWQMLYLSTRDAEDEGAEVRPSPFWEQARSLLPRAPLARRDLSEVVHPVESSPSLREYLRSAAVSGSVPADPEQRSLLKELPVWRRPASLSLPATRRQLASRKVFSAGQLERYARCPFAWFLSDLVGLEEMDQELDALRMGALVHDVLAHTYQALQSENRLPLREDDLPRAEELLEYHLDRDLRGLQVYGTAAERRLARQEAALRLRLLLGFDARSASRLRPRWLERRFGAGEGLDVGGLKLRGRMDRVDASKDDSRLFVIDYKNGSSVFGPSFAKDRAIQVPLYMLALQALHPTAHVIGGVYAALGSDKRGGIVSEEGVELLGGWRPGTPVAEEGVRAELEACLAIAQEAAGGIRQALIDASPADGCPRYCDLRSLCRGPFRRGEESRPSPAEAQIGDKPPGSGQLVRQLSLLEDGA